MTFRGVTLCLVLALAAAACSDDGEPAASTTTTTAETTTSSTAPERDPSTTTTAFDPATVEGEVEAAYLRSWDVYAEAVYNLELDEAALAEVYGGDLLDARRSELRSRIDEGRAAHVLVEHDYRIEVTGEDTAVIIDSYVNHQVLIDPLSKEPSEDDPNTTIVDAYTARQVAGSWVMIDLDRLA